MENQKYLRKEASEEKKGYSADFVSKVKEEFPNWSQIEKALNANSEILGRYLDDSRSFSKRPEDIIKAFQNGKAEEVLEAAKKAERINKLYIEWSASQE